MTEEKPTLKCKKCGSEFQPKKVWKIQPKWCSDACRQSAYRDRVFMSRTVTGLGASVTASKASE